MLMNAAPHLSLSPATADGPLHFYRELFEAVGELRNRLREKYERALPGHGYLVRKAISEAEDLAWQTPFPHLLLPDYAELRLAEVLAQEPALTKAA
jgi:hypothetical protein